MGSGLACGGLAALALLWATCSASSLDYLRNGQSRDAGVSDGRGDGTSSRDSAALDVNGSAFDAIASVGLDGPGVVGADVADHIDSESVDGEAWIDAHAESDAKGGSDSAGVEADVALARDAKEAGTGLDGRNGSGGARGTGGVVGSGGARGTGGVVGSGGARGTGGVVGSGGARGTGGVAGGGGATGLPMDAGSSGTDAIPDVSDPLPRCGGVADSEICWYLGRAGDSCVTSCAGHGGTSSLTASHIGNAAQGGSAQECGRLLSLLDGSGTVLSTSRSEDEGVGCVVALGLHWYITSPAYSDSARITGVERLCGCLR